MMKKKIVSLFGDQTEPFRFLNQKALEYARSRDLEYIWKPLIPFDYEEAVAALKEADYGIIDIQKFDETVFSQIDQNIQLLIRFGVGFENVDLQAAARHGIAVARTTAANTIGVAELAVLLMIAAKRRLKENQKSVENGVWGKNVAHELYGSTVGIVGFGNIGRKVAQLLKGFDCQVIVYDPNPNLQVMEELGVKSVTFEELCAQADAITLHAAACPSTYHLIDEKHLKMMKTTTVLVNTARGVLVDEAALAAALDNRWIAAAALDVLETEPAPKDFPLLNRDNVILTPHAASQTFESLWRIYEMAIDIAADFRDGKECRHILNPEYKKR